VSGKISLPNPQEPYLEAEWQLNGSALIRSSCIRHDAVADLAALTTQVALAVPIVVQPFDLFSTVTFYSGATAAVTPTNWWVAVYDNSATPALITQTADQLTGAIAANTKFSLALGATVRVGASGGVYWASIMVKAGTVPTLRGATLSNAVISTGDTGQVVLAQTHGSALVGTAPATIATPTAVATVPLVNLR
jgi:hypothetical protein